MSKQKYDLEERTAKFGEDTIRFAQKIPKSTITTTLIGQLVDAGTSIGANYCEADNAESKKTLNIKLAFAGKSLRKPSIGCE